MQNVGSGVVSSHSLIWYRIDELLLAFYKNYVPVLHWLWDIVRHWSKITLFGYPTCTYRPIGVTVFEFTKIFGVRKLFLLSVCVALFAWSYIYPFQYNTGLWHKITTYCI